MSAAPDSTTPPRRGRGRARKSLPEPMPATRSRGGRSSAAAAGAAGTSSSPHKARAVKDDPDDRHMRGMPFNVPSGPHFPTRSTMRNDVRKIHKAGKLCSACVIHNEEHQQASGHRCPYKECYCNPCLALRMREDVQRGYHRFYKKMMAEQFGPAAESDECLKCRHHRQGKLHHKRHPCDYDGCECVECQFVDNVRRGWRCMDVERFDYFQRKDEAEREGRRLLPLPIIYRHQRPEFDRLVAEPVIAKFGRENAI